MWTAPYVVCSNDHLTAIRRRERAPSTTSKPESALSAVMSAPTSCGHAAASALVRGEPGRLAGGFKLDIGNPVVLASAQAGFFILALERRRQAPEQRRLYVLECVDTDDGIKAVVDSAGDHRHHARF